ncbi:hypothetical protein HHI36_009623 [Cryptolaemus montrouzieri]|uniref:Hypoxia up-regulated protein 1 n=1 Tax=Cryptolaemus montrouzieri TaxID=559131 RepID=A0ABD2MGA6_9CUCU
MDESGILNLVNVEFDVEKTVMGQEEEGTFSKLGSTISKLFGGEDKTDEKQGDEKPSEEQITKDAANNTQQNESAKETKKEGTPALNDTVEMKNDTSKGKPMKPKVVTIKEPIKGSEKVLTIPSLTKEQFSQSQEKLKKLDDVEKEAVRRASALNSLETFVVDVQNKLSEDEFSEAATEEEKEKILASCSSVSDWLYEDGSDADAETYEKKLDSLKTETNPLFARVWEHHERPEALSALNSMLNHSNHFLNSAKNLTAGVDPDKDVFTDKEIESLAKIIQETEEWADKTIKSQNKLKKYEPVVLTVKSITDKMGVLDREVKYLVNKLRLWKPKKEETTDKPKNQRKRKEKEDVKDEVKLRVTVKLTKQLL